jgi:energy-coupling factor transporter ATP-binding protein EcfA2
VDADILLIDEVLAVGDASFQQKCFEVFLRLKAEGKTILFVTHDMGAVSRFCDRAMLIERGVVEAIGDPGTVGARYLQRNFGAGDAGEQGEDPDRVGDGTGEVVDGWFEENGRRTDVLRQGERCAFAMRVRFTRPVEDPICAFLIESEQGHPLFAISNEDGGTATGAHDAGDEAVFRAEFANVFAPGRLYVTPWVLHDGGAPIIDRRRRLVSAVNTAVHRSGGLVDLPARTGYERAVGAAR